MAEKGSKRARRAVAVEAAATTGATATPSPPWPSSLGWLDRYGMLGEYIRLELRMLWRNRVCRQLLGTIGIVVVGFSLLIAFSDIYGRGMSSFLLVYDYAIFALILLQELMNYEGNYIDGLMVRPGAPVLTLLRAKYVVYALAEFVPALLSLPAVFTGKMYVLTWLGLLLFIQGPVYCCLFQMAVYNRQTASLTVRVARSIRVGGLAQNLLIGLAFGAPLVVVFGLQALAGQEVMAWTLIVLGVAFILTSRLWLGNIYRRFMQRRYYNMEGFRVSRKP